MKNPLTPKVISDEINVHLSHVSRALKELEKVNLVSCLNPSKRKGKFFKITLHGIEIFDEVKNLKKV
ncbi:MAG: ArsR family transcriptional regulator [Candidatus Heimdallarchaeota archaeon]